MKALVDNDIILKGARYALLELLVVNFPPATDAVGILGSARYVLADVLRRKTSSDSTDVLQEVIAFIESNQTLEPTPDEQALAAEFESTAQIANLPLDTGESLLCAILIVRDIPLLFTGDKRAIESMEKIIDVHAKMGSIAGKVMCAEQLVSHVLTSDTVDEVRMAICSRPTVDQAIFNCCNCSSSSADLVIINENLNSYIGALRSVAPRVLCA